MAISSMESGSVNHFLRHSMGVFVSKINRLSAEGKKIDRINARDIGGASFMEVFNA